MGRYVLGMVDHYRKVWLLLAVCCLIMELFMITPKMAQAQEPVPIRYDEVSNTILLGEAQETASSEQVQPISRSVVTIEQLAAQLQELGHDELLIEQEEGVWLLSANLLLNGSVRLEATQNELSWLRLQSTSENEVFIRSQLGGSLLIEGIQVTSWDSTQETVDEQYQDGRSYLLASEGGEIEVISAEIAYLGWRTGEFGGLAWQGGLDESVYQTDPTTRASGRVEGSVIHDNFVGLSANRADQLVILRNQVYQNRYHGINIQHGSQGFEIAANVIYENGHHGILVANQSLKHDIYDNQLSRNVGHGIFLTQGANDNSLINNIISQNDDGIRLFAASNNLIEGNTVSQNQVGLRIYATSEADNPSGEPLQATNNQVNGNLMQNNHQNGVYLYDGADANVIGGNTIEGSNLHGIYVKSDRNQLRDNTIRANGHGITVLGVIKSDELASQANNNSNQSSGRENIIRGNTISESSGTGIRLLGAVNTLIGQDEAEPREEHANLIRGNEMDGVVIRNGSTGSVATDNKVLGNTIRDNGRHGVLIHGATSTRNTVVRNSITNNLSRGIKLRDGANYDVRPPRITIVNPDTGYIGGQTWPNALVEVYHDEDGEGQVYDGYTVADGQGFWGFTLSANPYLATAIAIDAEGNSTAFSGGKVFLPQYTVQPDKNNQPTIRVTGRDAVVTLQDIRNGLGGYAYLLQDQGAGVWQLDANLRIERDVTLNLTQESGVLELKLRSENPEPVEGEQEGNEIDYSSFVTLRTHNGIINIDGVKVYSWDPQAGDHDYMIENGRSYILAKYGAELNIRNAEIGYLGSEDGESYGLSWRDINDLERPELLRSRVTGEVINSRIHHNYYGIYTFQASSMRFEGNFFSDNIRYGFDPHDYTHDVVVERNESYNNGSHGFIISRGCQDFTFRYNKSFNNHDPTDSLAHGFMLDPGAPSSREVQAASTENLLEHNEAYNNQGYGLRVLKSTNNVIKNNTFYDNLHGIVLDSGSVDNTLVDNTLTKHILNGIFVRVGADRNQIINNSTIRNENHGISINSNHNLIRDNRSDNNLGAGMVFVFEEEESTDKSLLVEGNQIMSNLLADNQDDGLVLKGLVNSFVQENIIEGNAVHGIYLSEGSNNNQLTDNTVRLNGGVGIRLGGGDTLGNRWSQNQLYDNQLGGIDTTTGINSQIEPPRITQIQGQQLTGTTQPGSIIEIFSDNGEQGRYFEGQTIAGADGRFTFVAPNKWQAKRITAITTDLMGNSSRFAISQSAPAASVASQKRLISVWIKEFITKFYLNNAKP